MINQLLGMVGIPSKKIAEMIPEVAVFELVSAVSTTDGEVTIVQVVEVVEPAALMSMIDQ